MTYQRSAGRCDGDHQLFGTAPLPPLLDVHVTRPGPPGSIGFGRAAPSTKFRLKLVVYDGAALTDVANAPLEHFDCAGLTENIKRLQ